MLRHLLNLSSTLTSKGIKMNFMLRHLLNLSAAPLPAEELIELYAVFLTEFVYYSLTS